jgi:K+-sensing histidine kinase KdpD
MLGTAATVRSARVPIMKRISLGVAALAMRPIMRPMSRIVPPSTEKRGFVLRSPLTLYRVSGIVPVALSLAAILWTSIVLTAVHSSLMTDDPEHLALAYLLPTIFIAIFFGSTLAIASSFASGLAAAYFIYPPKFSFYIADPQHVAELGFILLLAVTASKVVGVLAEPAARKSPANEGELRHTG